MARFARVVVPGLAHHVTHRGNRQQPVFLTHQDRRRYRRWLAEYAETYDLEVWAYCLMTNHVHLIVVGQQVHSMASAIGRTHMRLARWVNHSQGWSGHLWANRYHSTPLDDTHLWRAVRYVETNPVRARIVDRAEDYPWSSAQAHCHGLDDPLLADSRPFPGPITNWRAWLAEGIDPDHAEFLRKRTSTGRPCGSEAFTTDLEQRLDRRLRPRKQGPKPGAGRGNT